MLEDVVCMAVTTSSISLNQRFGSGSLGTMARLAVVCLACVVVGFLLIVLAYCVPTSPMEKNLKESVEQLSAEGEYHALIGSDSTWTLDNYTVAAMLNQAAHGHSDPLRYAMLNPHAGEGETQIDQLSLGIGESDGKLPVYSQYWHGYLVFLKPLLLLLNLEQIRMFALMTCSVLVLLVAVLLARRGEAVAGVAFGVSFVAFNVVVTMFSLSLAACTFLALAGTLVVLWQTERRGRTLRGNVGWWTVPFLVLGATTSYFDFLCAPITTLGVSLAMLVYLSRYDLGKDAVVHAILGVVALSACWAVGYAAMWASKWVIATMITGQDVIAAGVAKIFERSASREFEAVDSAQISRWDAITKNFDLGFPKWCKPFVALMVAGTAIYVARNAKMGEGQGGTSLWWMLPLLVVAVFPYAWYFFAANHSYQHAFFTYRGQVVTLLCVALCCAGALTRFNGGAVPGRVPHGDERQGE